MDQLRLRLESSRRAVGTLEEALAAPFSVIVRDASVQRFEYSFEVVWKVLKVHLDRRHGMVCSSPKQCFREAMKVGLLTLEEVESCLVMTDDRNLTAHTYIEAVAEKIYGRLAEYLQVMKKLIDRMAAQIPAADLPAADS